MANAFQSIQEAQELLELQPGDTAAKVRAAVKRLSQKYHPDKEGGDAQKFNAVREAGRILLELLVATDGVLPSPGDIDSITYIALQIGQRYCTAEANGHNAKRRHSHRQYKAQVMSLHELHRAAAAQRQPPTAEAYALNELEQELELDITNFENTIESLCLQGGGLRTLIKNMRAPSLAVTLWQDTRKQIAAQVWMNRKNIAMAKNRLKALKLFEALGNIKVNETETIRKDPIGIASSTIIRYR